jgi:predicted NBD/HSP70 family sugar kinase
MLGHVHRDGSLTRAELTQRLAVSRSTVGALVADLTQLGLVQEVVPSGGAGVGRPSHVVGPHHGGPYVVAVDVDVANVTVASVGLGGTVLARELMQLPTGCSPHDVAHLVRDAVPRLHAAGCPTARIAGVGVSVPGTVDRRTGHVGIAPNLGWRDAELGALLTAAMTSGLPVEVGNDADLAALAEHRRGSARDCDDVVYLMGRVGVGAGIIVNGAPLRGRDGHAGEIGHNVVDASGPPCHCGKRGCVETYVGEGALLTLAGAPLPPTDEAVAAVFAAAHAGQRRALRAVRGLADRLGRALATLANTVNPERVLLGGSFTEVLRLARPEVEAAVERYAFEGSAGAPQLMEPRFGADSALLGAAEVAFSDLLADPLAGAARLG